MNASLGSDIFVQSFFEFLLSSLRPSDVRRLRSNVGRNGIVEHQKQSVGRDGPGSPQQGDGFPAILALRRTEKNRYVA